MKRPIIGITMGDPAGIGPELISKLFLKEEIFKICSPFVIGHPKIIREACKILGSDLNLNEIKRVIDCKFSFKNIDIFCPEGVEVKDINWGKIDPENGKNAALCLKKAIEMSLNKQIDGIISSPLNKKAFHLAGYNYIDELEFMKELSNSKEVFVVGITNDIWTISVTFHIPFKEIVTMIKKDRIFKYILLINETMKRIGIKNPKIAVAALNVHGGEEGLLGNEEIEEIKPAIEKAKNQGIQVFGPFPPDTIFLTSMRENFNAIVGMYHDQINIARKLIAQRRGITLYIGLPVPCGTTAHGTAYDIAGKGIADPGSIEDTLKYVSKLINI